MIVADTSALVTLSAAEVLDLVVAEFQVHTTATVEEELRATASYDDAHAVAARKCLDRIDGVEVQTVEFETFESARVDDGEGSCLELARREEAVFFLTDDLRALPELEALTEAQVAISPIVLRALVERGALEPAVASDRLDAVAETRDWLGSPIYRRARSLLTETD